MRRLSFGTGEVDRDRFDILYSGICMSEKGINRTELSTFNHLLEKLESVGKRIDGAKADAFVQYTLRDSGGEVLLEDAEYAMVNALHESIRWTKISARRAEEAYHWFENIPREVLKETQIAAVELVK